MVEELEDLKIEVMDQMLEQAPTDEVREALRSVGERIGQESGEFRAMLQSVLVLRERLDKLERENALASSVLDHLVLGIIFVRPGGRVDQMNEVAKNLIAQEDGLSLSDGHLVAENAEENRVLLELIDEACEGRVDQRPLRLQRSSGGTIELVVRSSEDGALVAVADPSPSPGATPEVLRGLYGLTPTEGRVASLLVCGSTSREIAARLGIGVETVRTHIKHILGKTGCHRQVDLVRRLVLGPGGLRAKTR